MKQNKVSFQNPKTGEPLSQQEIDEMFMRRCLQLAKNGRQNAKPNPMVGAVIVSAEGRIIGEGYHVRCGEGHAEVNAFASVKPEDEHLLKQATIYVSLEPCSHYGKTPPCAVKFIEKKIGRVVVGALDTNPLVAGRGIEKIRNAGIEVTTGVLAEESIKLNEIFMKYIVNKEPFVLYKSAMSLDGKIATAGGESQWISCEASRKEVHELRHQYMAIMVGSQTVLDDDPMLNCRLIEGKDPIRVVVDSSLRIPMTARLVKTARDIRTIVACTPTADEKKIKELQNAGVEILIVEDKDGHVNLKKLTEELGRMQIDSILLEGGATLAAAAFETGIVDKVQMYIAPKIIGGKTARTPVGGKGIEHLEDAWQLKNITARNIGNDICITGYIRREA